MAGNATAANLENFIYVSLNAFYQGNISFTSQNLGAGKLDRIPKILHCAQLCVLVLGTFLGLLAALFGPQLLGIYSQSPDVISAGMDRLLIVGVTYAICGLMDTTVGSLRGIGYSVLPMLVTLIGACGLRILIVATLFRTGVPYRTNCVLVLSHFLDLNVPGTYLLLLLGIPASTPPFDGKPLPQHCFS